MNNNTVYEWILQTTFTVSARAKSLQRIEPHLSTLVRPGDEILDLCCGSGFVSFWFEAQGARVTGLASRLTSSIKRDKSSYAEVTDGSIYRKGAIK